MALRRSEAHTMSLATSRSTSGGGRESGTGGGVEPSPVTAVTLRRLRASKTKLDAAARSTPTLVLGSIRGVMHAARRM